MHCDSFNLESICPKQNSGQLDRHRRFSIAQINAPPHNRGNGPRFALQQLRPRVNRQRLRRGGREQQSAVFVQHQQLVAQRRQTRLLVPALASRERRIARVDGRENSGADIAAGGVDEVADAHRVAMNDAHLARRPGFANGRLRAFRLQLDEARPAVAQRPRPDNRRPVRRPFQREDDIGYVKIASRTAPLRPLKALRCNRIRWRLARGIRLADGTAGTQRARRAGRDRDRKS